ncbi:MAG: hypothetical protein U5K70_04830 [Halodesulfurarchaeum sp.]|nr:hypothetical protein [Halodesulfurarchaeum sp.]
MLEPNPSTSSVPFGNDERVRVSLYVRLLVLYPWLISGKSASALIIGSSFVKPSLALVSTKVELPISNEERDLKLSFILNPSFGPKTSSAEFTNGSPKSISLSLSTSINFVSDSKLETDRLASKSEGFTVEFLGYVI